VSKRKRQNAIYGANGLNDELKNTIENGFTAMWFLIIMEKKLLFE